MMAEKCSGLKPSIYLWWIANFSYSPRNITFGPGPFIAHLSLMASLSDSRRQRMSLTLTGPFTFLTSCLASLFKKTTLTWVIPPLDPIWWYKSEKTLDNRLILSWASQLKQDQIDSSRYDLAIKINHQMQGKTVIQSIALTSFTDNGFNFSEDDLVSVHDSR